MTTSYDLNSGPEHITDHLARFVWCVAPEDQTEPEPGSVVLLGGDWGTAWQRNFSDGLWHSTRRRGGPKDWAWLLSRRNLRLVYDAERRPAGRYDREPSETLAGEGQSPAPMSWDDFEDL